MQKNYVQDVKMIYNLAQNSGSQLHELSTLFENMSKVFKKNAENPEIIDSILNSKDIFDKKLTGKFLLNLDSLKNDNSNSFYIIPIFSKNHAFSSVIKKINDKYNIIIIDSNDKIKQYIFKDKKKLSELLDKYLSLITESSVEDIKGSFKKDASETYHTNIKTKGQSVGNCFYIQNIKAIKIALVDHEKIHEYKRLRIKPKLKWFKDGNKISTRNFKNNLVKEYKEFSDVEIKKEIEKLTDIYNYNKKISSYFKGLKRIPYAYPYAAWNINQMLNKSPEKLSYRQAQKIHRSHLFMFLEKNNKKQIDEAIYIIDYLTYKTEVFENNSDKKSAFEEMINKLNACNNKFLKENAIMKDNATDLLYSIASKELNNILYENDNEKKGKKTSLVKIDLINCYFKKAQEYCPSYNYEAYVNLKNIREDIVSLYKKHNITIPKFIDLKDTKNTIVDKRKDTMDKLL